MSAVAGPVARGDHSRHPVRATRVDSKDNPELSHEHNERSDDFNLERAAYHDR